MHIDDAIQFLSNYARRRCTDGGIENQGVYTACRMPHAAFT